MQPSNKNKYLLKESLQNRNRISNPPVSPSWDQGSGQAGYGNFPGYGPGQEVTDMTQFSPTTQPPVPPENFNPAPQAPTTPAGQGQAGYGNFETPEQKALRLAAQRRTPVGYGI